MYFWNDKNNRWETDVSASQIPIKDISESYESKNIEGALQELAGERDAQKLKIVEHTTKIESLENSVDWLKVNGGGGSGSGGTVMPTLTTSDSLDQVVPKGQEITLSVFFSSPNLGNGSLILLVNNKEVDSFILEQGSNTINIGSLTELRNKVVVYAKDRAGLVSNEITYNIINGGVSLTLDFDYYADYVVGTDILMRYTVDTDQPNPELWLTINEKTNKIPCKTGFNQHNFKGLAEGTYKISLKVVCGEFVSETYSFTLVILNSESLYLSSEFGSNEQCTYGVPVVIPYRISYKDDTPVTVNLYLNSELSKTLVSKRGSYAWTISDLDLGLYSYKIEGILEEQIITLEGSFEVIQGDYTPIQINTDGLVYRMASFKRTNQDIDKEEFLYNRIKTTLYDFNFESNGWLNGALVCNGGAYAVIDYAPFENNVPYSTTIEIDFKSSDIGIIDARVLECKDIDTLKGFYVALNESRLNSIGQEARVYITPEERTTVSIMVDRTSRFAKIFVNGICTSAFKLTDTGSGTSSVYENFQHSGKIYIGCDRNIENIGNCEIYDIRIYNRGLSDDDVVRNVIAQENDLRKQEELYNFCFDNNTLPVMRLYSDEVENRLETMTNTTPITMRASYRNTNSEKYGQPFDLNYCKVYWQGTSSLDYIRKNYNIELYNDNFEPYYYTPYVDGVEEFLFCLKCDYMESSHSRNVGIGKLMNRYWYSSKNPAQLKDSKIRNSIEGFPILLYINDEFMGVYNFNTDRYSNATFGYTDVDNCLVYEVSANSDTTAGAFFSYIEGSTELSKLDYYKRDFLSLYPPTRRVGNDDFSEIMELVNFVDNSSDEVFVENINNNVFFNKEYLLRYRIYAILMGAVDSLGKNMKLASWDKGKTWYPQVYDGDTTLGLDNSGFLRFPESNIKVEAGTYNTSNSRLWKRVEELFAEDIKVEYAKMRNTFLTLDHIYECIIEEQMDKIPATFYNQDMQTKYLQFGSSFLGALHGQGKQQVMSWISSRLLYVDTYLGYWSSTSDYIQVRSSKRGYIYLDLETYDNMFLQVKWRNSGNSEDVNAIQVKEMKRGEVTRFTFKSDVDTDQEIRVYGGRYIKSLGDLTNLAPTNLIINNAPRLTQFVCHSDNLKTLDLSACTNLQVVNLKDCSTLGVGDQSIKTLDVSNCVNLKEVDCRNTQLYGINLGLRGTNIEKIGYPKTIQSISLSNCVRLKGVYLEHGNSCSEMVIINCPNIKEFGDREFNTANQTYKYENGYFLSGVQKIELDNSAVDLEYFDITYCRNLQNVTLKNMPNIEAIYIGVNEVDGLSISDDYEYNVVDREYDINKIVNSNSLTFSISNVPNLKDFYITCGNRKSSKDKIMYGMDNSLLILNTLDLSNLSIENLYIYNNVEIYNLLLPTTLKNLIRHPYMDFDGSSDPYRTTSGVCTKWNDERAYEMLYETGYVYNIFGANRVNGRHIMSKSGGFIHNVYCPSVKGSDFKGATESPFLWDLEGLVLNDFYNYGDNMTIYADSEGRPHMKYTYSTNKIDIKNLNCKPKNNTTPFNTTWVNSVEGSIDLSDFKGKSLVYAFSNIDNNLSILLSSDVLKQVKYFKGMLKGAKTNQLTWKDIEPVIPLFNEDINTIIYNTFLKEQADYETDAIDVINESVEIGHLGATNLRYIKELKGYLNRTFNDLNKASYIIKIGKITALGDVSALLNSCQLIEEVGDIVVEGDVSGYVGLGLINNCPKLTKVGNITVKGQIAFSLVSSCKALEELGKIVGKVKSGVVALFKGNSSIKSINISELDLYDTSTIKDYFYGDTSLESIDFTGTRLFDNPNLSSCSTENAFRECKLLNNSNIINFKFHKDMVNTSGTFYKTGITQAILPDSLLQPCKGNDMFSYTNITEAPVMPEGYSNLNRFISNTLVGSKSTDVVLQIPSTAISLEELGNLSPDLTSLTLNIPSTVTSMKRFFYQHSESSNRETLEYIRVNMEEGSSIDLTWAFAYKNYFIYGLNLSRLGNIEDWGMWGSPVLKEIKGVLSTSIMLHGTNCVTTDEEGIHYIITHLADVTGAPQTIVVNTTLLSYLSEEELSNAQSLGWTISTN